MDLRTSTAWVAALFLVASTFPNTVALRLLLLALGVVLASAAVARHRDSLRPVPPIWLPFALWAAWAACSLIWSINPDASLKELKNEIGYTAIGLWICFIGAQAPNAARVFLIVPAIAIAAACGIGLYEYTRGFERYLAGRHGGPGDHSSALLTFTPCVAMTIWYGARAGWPQWRTLLAAMLLGLIFASAYTTLNRTVWIGLAVQFLLLGSLLLLRAGRGGMRVSGRAKRAIAAVCLIAVATSAAMVIGVQAEREALGARSMQRDVRLVLWPEIVARIAERPLTGYGFGRGLMLDALRAKFASLDFHLWHAHNLVLEAAIQLGLPGVLLLLLLLGALLREGWRYAASNDELSAAAGMALIGVVAGMVVRNMTDSLFVRQNSLLFWGVAGVLLAIGLRRRETDSG